MEVSLIFGIECLLGKIGVFKTLSSITPRERLIFY